MAGTSLRYFCAAIPTLLRDSAEVHAWYGDGSHRRRVRKGRSLRFRREVQMALRLAVRVVRFNYVRRREHALPTFRMEQLGHPNVARPRSGGLMERCHRVHRLVARVASPQTDRGRRTGQRCGRLVSTSISPRCRYGDRLALRDRQIERLAPHCGASDRGIALHLTYFQPRREACRVTDGRGCGRFQKPERNVVRRSDRARKSDACRRRHGS